MLTALTAAAGGNVTGSSAQFVQAGLVNYLQQQGAGLIGQMVDNGALTEGSPLHAALHAIVGCAGAAASSQSCGAGAMGAATSSLLTNLFADDPNETAQEKQAKGNIIESLVAGIAAGTGTNAGTATTAGIAATDNNYLTPKQRAEQRAAIQSCKQSGNAGSAACGKAYDLTKLDAQTEADLKNGKISLSQIAAWQQLEMDASKSLAGAPYANADAVVAQSEYSQLDGYRISTLEKQQGLISTPGPVEAAAAIYSLGAFGGIGALGSAAQTAVTAGSVDYTGQWVSYAVGGPKPNVGQSILAGGIGMAVGPLALESTLFGSSFSAGVYNSALSGAGASVTTTLVNQATGSHNNVALSALLGSMFGGLGLAGSSEISSGFGKWIVNNGLQTVPGPVQDAIEGNKNVPAK
ncbi:hypothetical protein R75465_07876 [Paraburkholderia aspalathi]|nr:hypothetical protein R75465_07876 [Paraburkholderia aspalathi]